MKSFHSIIFLFFITIISFWACKPLEKLPEYSSESLPKNFAQNNDSSNSAPINWREYFADPTLNQLIENALKQNWDILIAQQGIEAAQSNILFAKGLLKPIVNASATTSLRKFGLYTMDGAGNITTDIRPNQIVPIHLPDYFIGLQTTWEVDIWGKLNNQKRAAFARFLASQEGKRLIITNLVADIALAYYELLALDNNLKIIDETIQLQENALAIVKVQKEAALANSLAIQQFENQLLRLRAMRLETLQNIIETQSIINSLSANYPQNIARDTAYFNNTLPQNVKAGIPGDLLKNRPDIRQAEYELVASKADVQAARLAFYPSLIITGYGGFQAFQPKFLFQSPESIAYGLLGGLTAPLLNRSAIKAKFNLTRANQLAALYNYQKTILTAYTEVYNELYKINNLKEIYDLKMREVQLLDESIDTSFELFRTGRASYLEILITQQNALQAKMELLFTKKNQFLSRVKIYKALGGGWQ